MGGTAYETESERLRREGGEEMKAKMQTILDEREKTIEEKEKIIEETQTTLEKKDRRIAELEEALRKAQQ